MQIVQLGNNDREGQQNASWFGLTKYHELALVFNHQGGKPGNSP